MDDQPIPRRPVDAYKEIIDGLVEGTPSVASRLVMEQGRFSLRANAEKENDLVRSLTPEERATLAEMLIEERAGATHDVLAAVTWWLDCREVGLTYRGERMPVDLSGMGLHGDYVGRRAGWEWPETEDEA